MKPYKRIGPFILFDAVDPNDGGPPEPMLLSLDSIECFSKGDDADTTSALVKESDDAFWLLMESFETVVKRLTLTLQD